MFKKGLEIPKITQKVGPVYFNAYTMRGTWDLRPKERTDLPLHQPPPAPKDTALWWDSRLQVTSTIEIALSIFSSYIITLHNWKSTKYIIIL